MHLNASTIYYNSIEIEWKPGGISDILNYIVKYRPYKSLNEYEFLLNDFYDKSINDDNYLFDDFDSDSTFTSINTTHTKLKIGGFKPNTLYEFKVSAANLLGLSKETESILIRTAATSNLCFF